MIQARSPGTQQVARPSSEVLLQTVRFALSVSYRAAPRLCLGLVATSLIAAFVPAGIALSAGVAARGLRGIGEASPTDLRQPLLWLGATVGLMLLASVLGPARVYFRNRLGDELTLVLSLEVMHKAERLDLSFFEDPESQSSLARAQANPRAQFMSFLTAATDGATAALQALSLLAVVVWIEPLITPFILVASIPLLVHRWRLARERHALRRLKTTQRRWSGYYFSQLTDKESFPATKVMLLGPLLRQRFRATLQDIHDAMQRLYRREAAGQIVATTVFLACLLVVIAWVSHRALAGTLGVDQLVTFGLASLRLRTSLDSLAAGVANCLENSLYINDIIEFLDSEPLVAATGDLRPAVAGAIELQAVGFSYPGTDSPALRDISLRILPGQTVAIVGQNGSGKTTLAKLLARLYDVGCGRVLVDKIDIRDFSVEHLHRQLAIVFENPMAYELTVAENIALGDWERLADDRPAIEHIVTAAGLDSLIERLPEGLDTQLGRTFGQVTLSRGQWQRLAIARALARRPKILILDEPTSNLDARAERELFTAMRSLAQGATTVLISHRFSTVRAADVVFVLEEGRLVEQGGHHDLIAAGGLYAQLYRLHREVIEAGDNDPATAGG